MIYLSTRIFLFEKKEKEKVKKYILQLFFHLLVLYGKKKEEEYKKWRGIETEEVKYKRYKEMKEV